MAYGKKRGRSSSSRRKSNRKKRVQRGLSRTEKKEVHRIIAGEAELKKVDSEYILQTPRAVSTVIDLYKYVIQGVQADERIGDEITVKRADIRFKFYIPLNRFEMGGVPGTARDIDECPSMFRWFVCSIKNNVQNPIPATTTTGLAYEFPQFFKVGESTFEMDNNMHSMYRDVNTDLYTVHSTGKFTLGLSQFYDVRNKETSGTIGAQKVLAPPYNTGAQIEYILPDSANDASLFTEMRAPGHMSSYGCKFACMKSLTVGVPKAGLGKLRFVRPQGQYDESEYYPKKRYFFVMLHSRFDGNPYGPSLAEDIGVEAYVRHNIHYTDS